jgi:hypothetical protein
MALISDSGNAVQDQRDFIKYFIDEILTPHGIQPSHEEIDEMESVLYSVSFGKQEFHRKVAYQAYSAAISNP